MLLLERLAHLTTISLCLFGMLPLHATVWPVTAASDAGTGSLREAVDVALDGDTILIQVSDTIKLDSLISLSANPLYIQGLDARDQVLSGQGASQIFEIESGSSVFLSHLSLVYGWVDPSFFAPLGGAILSRGSIETNYCIFAYNRAVDGGAIFLNAFRGDSIVARFIHTTFYQNEATLPNLGQFERNGGAIGCNGRGPNMGSVRLYGENLTVVQNKAVRSGGGIFLIGEPIGGVSFRCNHCTIADNEASLCGGIDNSEAELARVENTLVEGNNGRAGFEDFFGAIVSSGYNLIGANGGQRFDTALTDVFAEDPLLGPLGQAGGEVPVQTLLCGSPAIDQADPVGALTLDARNRNYVGNPDIGSYERDESVDLEVISQLDDGFGSLRRAVILSCPGDTLVLTAVFDSISLTSSIDLIHDLNIIGPLGNGIFLDGQYQTRLMEIEAGVTAYVEGLNFVRGKPTQYGGGAIRNQGTLHVHAASFLQNEATSGGAIATYAIADTAHTYITNCTFARNKARDLDGGAIDVRSLGDTASLTIQFCTIRENTAGNKGGGLHNLDGNVSIANSIVAVNEALQSADIHGDIFLAGPNIVGDDLGLAPLNPLAISSQLVLPGFAMSPLSGAPDASAPTYRPLINSAALDAGTSNDILTDQLGRNRMIGPAPDLGSVEYDPLVSIPTEARPSWIAWPNPADGQLFVKGDAPVDIRITITNVLGQPMWDDTPPATAQNEWTISVEHLPAGLYVLTARHHEKILFHTQVLIK